MNYFNSSEARQLFNCQTEDNNIEDYLSYRIDIFDEIINQKQDVSPVVAPAFAMLLILPTEGLYFPTCDMMITIEFAGFLPCRYNLIRGGTKKRGLITSHDCV